MRALSSFCHATCRSVRVLALSLSLPVSFAFAAGGAYSIDFSAARPGSYYKLYPQFFPCTASNGVDYAPIAGADFTDNVESLAPKDLALGQIVAFELAINVNGDTSPEDGQIVLEAGWNTILTSGDLFGYHASNGVYCAFIDQGDPSHADPGGDARLLSFSWEHQDNENPTGPDEIVGVFDIGGLDSGDHVVLEVWLVLQDQLPLTASGNVQSRLINAWTSTGDAISTGNQTVPLLKVKDFLSAKADLALSKTDSSDPVTFGDIFSYTLTVTNRSEDVVANQVEVVDTLDPHTRFVSATADGPIGYPSSCTHDGSASGGTVLCDLGALVPGDEVNIVIEVEVLDSAPSTGIGGDGTCSGSEDLCNAALVSAITDDDDETNNSDSEPTAVTTYLLLDCPADTVVACDASMLPAETGTPSVAGNCPGGPSLSYNDTLDFSSSPCPDTFTIQRVWTATDACGGLVTCTQRIDVVDTAPPLLASLPADTVVSCDAVPPPASPTASDNCDADVLITFSESRNNGPCNDEYSLLRVWVATDNCGNASSHTQTVSVVDTSAPLLSGVPADQVVPCHSVPDPAQPTASDSCDPSPSIGFQETLLPGSCANSYQLLRVWTATDVCGNALQATQRLTVVDTTAPLLANVPEDLTVSCDSIPAAANVTASDLCDDAPRVTLVESTTPGSCPGHYTITRVWTATDECGNSTTATQTLSVVDTEAPTLLGVPGDEVVDCQAVPAPATVSAEDNCDPLPVVRFAEQRVDGDCPSHYRLLRVWTATDHCENTVSATQTIEVLDTTGPQLAGLPADETVECDQIPDPPTGIATDECDPEPLLTYQETRIDGDCPSRFVLQRVWTATDACGNRNVHTQRLSVVDTTDPVLFGVPGDLTVECDTLPAPAQPTAEDNCDDAPLIAFLESTLPGDCPSRYVLQRVWSATDHCGNQHSQTQRVTVVDTSAPQLTGLPSDLTVACHEIPSPAEPGATDNCDPSPVIAYNQQRVDGSCPDRYTLLRTWTATDACGNASSHTQALTVEDRTAPILSGVPSHLQVECDAIPLPALPTASDLCDPSPQIYFEEGETAGSCSGERVLRRLWTAIDRCGNSVTATQMITVVDTTSPLLLDFPEDGEVSCDAVPPPAGVTVLDNCDESPSLQFEEERVDGDCDFRYQLLRRWTASDACGNSTSCVQILRVRDLTPPLLEIPDDAIVECDAIPSPAAITTYDNCSTVLVDFVEESMGPCEGRVTELTIQYQGSNSIHLIIEQRLPHSHAIAYEGTLTPGEIFHVSGTGNDGVLGSTIKLYVDGEYFADIHTSCSVPVGPGYTVGPFVVLDGRSRDGGFLCPVDDLACIEGCRYSLFRTWTARDACNNQTSATQRIDVTDLTPPLLTGVPNDGTVSCEAIPSPDGVGVTDNCAPSLPLNFRETRIDGNSPDQFELVRIWSATDACNNSVTATQLLSVIDLTPPLLLDLPLDMTVECDAVPTAADVSAVDQCDPAPLLSLSETNLPGACDDSYTVLRVWRATDRSGNSISATQTLEVVDTQAPVLFGLTPSRTVEYDAVPDPDQVDATDSCAGSVPVTLDESSSEGPLPGPYVITRSYTATDSCGNLTNVLQTITVLAPAPIIIAEMETTVSGESFSMQFTTSEGLSFTPEYSIGPLGDDSAWQLLPLTSEQYENGMYSFTFDSPVPDASVLFIRVLRPGQ